MDRAFNEALGAAVFVAALGLASVPLRAQQALPGNQPAVEQGHDHIHTFESAGERRSSHGDHERDTHIRLLLLLSSFFCLRI